MAIPESERGSPCALTLDLAGADEMIECALGVEWNIERDVFQFRLNLPSHPTTRRGILATVASVYDPLGLIAPVILKGKAILQEISRT